jgi:hypothetical protein
MLKGLKETGKFTNKAKGWWNDIPPETQQSILNNVWCMLCFKMTAIVNVEGTVRSGKLVLSGVCATCGSKVERVIKASEILQYAVQSKMAQKAAQQDRDAYGFPYWMLFSIVLNLPSPVPHIEISEDGYGVYIEPTKAAGFATMATLQRMRKVMPESFPNVIGEMLTEIHNMEEFLQLVSSCEKFLGIRISYIAHTLRMSESGDNIDRIVLPIEKFINPYGISVN